MTITISVSDFRQNLSGYLDQVSRGLTLVVKDDKKNENIAQVTAVQKWDPVAYGQALKRAAGTFTVEKHPEWATLKDVQKWLRETRKNADRDFSYIK